MRDPEYIIPQKVSCSVERTNKGRIQIQKHILLTLGERYKVSVFKITYAYVTIDRLFRVGAIHRQIKESLDLIILSKLITGLALTRLLKTLQPFKEVKAKRTWTENHTHCKYIFGIIKSHTQHT